MMEKNAGFNRYPLHERVLERLPRLGFETPTRVQQKVIPLFLQKRNLLVEAPTGTGKTAAYGLPLISRLNLLKRSTQALVLLPSRELALQVSTALQSYFEGDSLRVGAVYGGSSMEESCTTIKSSPHILVAVPGRLKDVMSQYQFDFLWRDIKFLIVDEADKLLEMGFQKDFDDIRSHIRKSAQIGFFSATISADSETLIRQRIPRIQSLRLSPREMLKNIRFTFSEIPQGRREPYLAALIQQQHIDSALIFTAKRADIYALTGFLRNLGYKAEAYFGAQEQHERQNILQRFKQGHIQFLVASDLAARGLDIPELPAVINLSMPEVFDFYLHRVGRTGRAGNKGRVYNLIKGKQEKAFMSNHHRKIGLRIDSLHIAPPANELAGLSEGDKWVKIHLSRGKQDKIRKGDIAGFLIHQGGISAEDVGTITIYDSYSIADVPYQAYEQLSSSSTQPLRIKGKSVKVRKYQLEEQARKADSVKRLLRNRKG
ncbi:MAG: DEAD/DEAH box helicase [Bacteroidetes bacterium]|nr:MAG: DEAD/DEAH box helicase [Bacteroidota bacterium]